MRAPAVTWILIFPFHEDIIDRKVYVIFTSNVQVVFFIPDYRHISEYHGFLAFLARVKKTKKVHGLLSALGTHIERERKKEREDGLSA